VLHKTAFGNFLWAKSGHVNVCLLDTEHLYSAWAADGGQVGLFASI
jgi:hypothetical protein